jgi:hypothetical protein
MPEGSLSASRAAAPLVGGLVAPHPTHPPMAHRPSAPMHCLGRWQLVEAHTWAVRRRRYNRWVARVIDDDAAGAASADDEEEDSDDASEGSKEGSDSSNDNLLVGRAADGSSDSRSERVLMVRSLTRRSDLVRADGSRLQQQQWFEIVPTDRIDTLLSSMWHMGGVQSLSTPKLYAAVVAEYVGVSHAAVSSFISRQEAAALSKANLVADQIVSPSLPEALNESWSGDLTFLDATIPSGSYKCFLTVIDALLRMAFTVPLRDKSAATLGAAYEELIRANGAPRTLVQDSAVETCQARCASSRPDTVCAGCASLRRTCRNRTDWWSESTRP